LIIPHFRQHKTYDFSEFQEEINEFEKSLSDAPENKLFLFDPNTATREELQSLNIDPAIVNNILKYRDHGGIFRKGEDLLKIYGLDSTEYNRIEPYIRISASGIPGKEKSGNIKKLSVDSSKMFHDDGVDQNHSIVPLPINISDSAALVSIYGIGPVLSVRIIKYRNLLGGYVSKDQLMEVYGMTDENFNHIRNAIYIDTSAITPININTADFSILSRHPYLNDYQSRAIIAYREIKGSFRKTDEIEKNGILSYDDYMRIKPYLVVK